MWRVAPLFGGERVSALSLAVLFAVSVALSLAVSHKMLQVVSLAVC